MKYGLVLTFYKSTPPYSTDNDKKCHNDCANPIHDVNNTICVCFIRKLIRNFNGKYYYYKKVKIDVGMERDITTISQTRTLFNIDVIRSNILFLSIPYLYSIIKLLFFYMLLKFLFLSSFFQTNNVNIIIFMIILYLVIFVIKMIKMTLENESIMLIFKRRRMQLLLFTNFKDLVLNAIYFVCDIEAILSKIVVSNTLNYHHLNHIRAHTHVQF